MDGWMYEKIENIERAVVFLVQTVNEEKRKSEKKKEQEVKQNAKTS